MDNLKFEIWKKKLEICVGKVGNFEKKNGNLKNCKFEKMWKSGKVWKFGKKQWKFRKILEILETLKIFIWKFFGNLDN